MTASMQPTVGRRSACKGIVGSLLLAGAPGLLRAQEGKTARIIVGVPAGAPGDLLARGVAERMRPEYASSLIVDNITGASTQLAIGAAVRSSPDGSTLLLSPSSPLSVFPFTYRNLPYKPDQDLIPVSLAAYFNHAFAVGPMVPREVQTMKDYLAWAQANAERASYGTSGTGTIPHLLAVLVARQAGVALINVPYRGSSVGVQDLIGGQRSDRANNLALVGDDS